MLADAVIGGEDAVDVFRMSDPNHYKNAERINIGGGYRHVFR